MTLPPGAQAEIREEVDIVSVDPLFLERQRNRYAHRGVAMIVLLNGVAAIALLAALATSPHDAGGAERFGDAMIVFGSGAAAGLASAFFAYLSRTWRLERGGDGPWRRPLRWLAVAAAIAGVACFVTGLNVAQVAGEKAAEPARAEKADAQTRAAPKPERPSP